MIYKLCVIKGFKSNQTKMIMMEALAATISVDCQYLNLGDANSINSTDIHANNL